jgi:Zn-finger nucleic acid-binding protein
MLPKLMQCPQCKHVWIYEGESEMRIGCPVCTKTISGQKIGLCTISLEQYAELKGNAYLKKFQKNLEDLSDELAMLQELEKSGTI